MTPEQIIFACITAVLGLIAISVTVRNWAYGGSVVKVEIELGRQDAWHGIVTG